MCRWQWALRGLGAGCRAGLRVQWAQSWLLWICLREKCYCARIRINGGFYFVPNAAFRLLLILFFTFRTFPLYSHPRDALVTAAMVYDPIRDCDVPSPPPAVRRSSSLRGLLNDAPPPPVPIHEDAESHRPTLSNILNDAPRHRSMLPPQQPIHPELARSPSMSLSPRSQNHSLPYAGSRPGSAAGSAHPFGHDPRQGTLSPVLSARHMSEDHPRPTSSSSASGRRYTEPVVHTPVAAGHFSSSAYRPRQTSTPGHPSSSYAPRFTPQPTTTPSSPATSQHTPYTPHHSAPSRTIPYIPHRQSAPSSVLRPIYPDEIARLRQLAHTNNPLRRRPARVPEHTPVPRRSLPSENDHSYFPPQATHHTQQHQQQQQWDDRRSSAPPSDISHRGPTPSSTPGAPHSSYSQYPPNWEAQTPGSNGNGNGNGNVNDDKSGRLGKRRARDEEEDGDDERNKKVVSGPVAGQVYSKKVAAVAEHCMFLIISLTFILLLEADVVGR